MTTAFLDECTLIEDRRGNLWLGVNELQRNGYYTYNNIDNVEVDDQFYELMGYSEKRRAFWVRPVQIEGAAETLEEEFIESSVGDSQSGSQ